MRLVAIWREDEDYSRMMSDWINEFEKRTGKEVENLDPDSSEGESICRAYDVVEYPTIMALGDDGAVLGVWRGKILPTFDEVAYWVK